MNNALFYQIASASRPNITYDVRISKQLGHTCTCKAWEIEASRYLKPRCKHISAAFAILEGGKFHFGFDAPVSDEIDRPVYLGPEIWKHDFVLFRVDFDKATLKQAHAEGVPALWIDDCELSEMC